MTFTSLITTKREEWRWLPYFHIDGPRTLRNGKKFVVADLAWLFFYLQVDNDYD